MCEFCESLTDRDKEINWLVRSTMADDNICEFVNGDNCENCKDCSMNFTIGGYKWSDDTYIGIKYEQKITATDGTEVIINPFSETIQFNFCPICGKQISRNVKEFKDYYSNQIEINDK